MRFNNQSKKSFVQTCLLRGLILLLAGCAQLGRDEAPPAVRQVDAANGLMAVECNGWASTMAVCYQAAKQACPSGYRVEENQWNYANVGRRLLFKCN